MFKPVLASLALISSTSVSANDSDWWLLDGSKNTLLMADFASESEASIWVAIININENKPDIYNRTRVSYRCSDRSFILSYIVAYDLDNKVVDREETQNRNYAPPESLFDTLLTSVCQRDRGDGFKVTIPPLQLRKIWLEKFRS